MGENRNRRNKRRSKNSLGNRMALIGITAVVASLAVVVHIGGASLRERDLEYQAREQALEKALAKEEARAAELPQTSYSVVFRPPDAWLVPYSAPCFVNLCVPLSSLANRFI